MNRAARLPFHALCRTAEQEATAVLGERWDFSLCHVCRYVEWVADNAPRCLHPIDRLADDGEHTFDVWGGSDCWGFRPMGTPAEVLEHLREQVEWQRELKEETP